MGHLPSCSRLTAAASLSGPGSFEGADNEGDNPRGFSKESPHTANIPFASWKLLRLRGQRASVSVAVLLPVFGSMTSVGIETVAVLEIELVADALIVPVAL